MVQICLRGQVDHWVEPYIRLTVGCLRVAERPYLKCLLVQVVADALYYNASLTLNILQKLGVATEVFNLWFQMLQQTNKSGERVNFKREHDKKVCCLGLTSLLQLPPDQLPGEALERVFKATLELFVAYKDQVAEAAKEEPEDDDDMNDGLETNDDEDDESDKDMGFDAEDGDEADSLGLQRLAAQAKSFCPADDDDDDSDDDFSDDEDLQSPIDEVDPFVFFYGYCKSLASFRSSKVPKPLADT